MSSKRASTASTGSDREIDLTALDDNSSPDDSVAELLVKSSERVRDLGEVYTPSATVDAMLDLLPEHAWAPHPSFTFFEPGCGNGNFLVAILQRKLDAISKHHAQGTLPAGGSASALQFHALEALSSIYAVDISPENVVGGTIFNEVGARQRLLDVLVSWLNEHPEIREETQQGLLDAARWIVERNVIIGNLLPFNADGSPSRREDLPLVEYRWDPESLAVTLVPLALGLVMERGNAEASGMIPLFWEEAVPAWSGPAFRLYEAQVAAAPLPKGPVRNGKAR